jgi:hypothetical protein
MKNYGLASPRDVEEQHSLEAKLSVLMLCDDSSSHANTLLEHIEAFGKFSRHRVSTFNPRGIVDCRFLDLNDFDVVVIHYSLCIIADSYLSPELRDKVSRFEGLKVLFIQDDYRWVNQISSMMRYLDIKVLFTLVPEAEIPKIWDEARLPHVVKLNTLAGYIPDGLVGVQAPPIELRPIDVGYRGRELPYWLGRLSQDKVTIAQGFLARVERYGLCCDIAWKEYERIYGDKWNRFIMSCKAVLGTESGSSITDFDGSIEAQTRSYLASHPDADFQEVHREILQPYEGNVRMNVISPRIFEAIALHTPLILFEGEYSGVVNPWTHYIPLAKDFSNMDQVVEKLCDTKFLRDLACRSYDDIVSSGRFSLKILISQFDRTIFEYGYRRTTQQFALGYHLAQLERRYRHGLCQVERRFRLVNISGVYVGKIDLIGRALLATRLLVGVPALRRLCYLYVRNRKLQKEIHPLAFFVESIRLGLVLRVLNGTLRFNPSFHVSADFDPLQGALTFKSVSAEQGAPAVPNNASEFLVPRSPIGSYRSQSQEPGIRSIVWNHSAVGSRIKFPAFPSGPDISLGPCGIYQFEVISKLARKFPNEAWCALKPALESSAKSPKDSKSSEGGHC